MMISAPSSNPPRIRNSNRISPDDLERRWSLIPEQQRLRPALADASTMHEMECYRRNIENFIGTVKVPVGHGGTGPGRSAR